MTFDEHCQLNNVFVILEIYETKIWDFEKQQFYKICDMFIMWNTLAYENLSGYRWNNKEIHN